MDVFVWKAVFLKKNGDNLELYFLDVGQGDSELIISDGIKILIDGGPANGTILNELSKILPPLDRYLDLVIMTHPQLDHYGGLIDVLKNYQVGAFVANGRKGESGAYDDLVKVIEEKSIPYVKVGEGDVIRRQDAVLKILNPSIKNLSSYELNDTSIVALLEKNNLRALYTGDAGANIEKELAVKYDLAAQVLKIGHHGSKYSSDPEFLKEVAPDISIIEVGKNSYGHPTKEVLSRLEKIQSAILRTDWDKNIRLIFDGKNLRVLANKTGLLQ